MLGKCFQLLVTIIAALALNACASSGDPSQMASTDCFTAGRVVSWETHDGRSLDVTDTLGDHYRIHFCNACPGVRDAVAVDFEGGVNGQMCGGPDEVVRIRGRSCRVSSIMRVGTKAEELDGASCD